MTEQSYCGHMNDMAGSAIAFDLVNITKSKLDELSRIDLLTPFYREKMDSLPNQQRKIVASLIIHGKPARINELTVMARLGQQNKTSSQVCRLVKSGLLEKQGAGYYISSKDPDLERYLVMRIAGDFRSVFMSERSKELIPDRENPISYFIKHREKIINKFYQN